MRLNWRDLGSVCAEIADGTTVEIEGFAATVGPSASASHFILTSEPGCCTGCLPRDRWASVEVFAGSPVPLRGRSMRLAGIWRVKRDDPDGWRYQLREARLLDPPGWTAVTRRGV